MFCKKDVLRNVAKFTEKHLCQSLFLSKVAGLSHFLNSDGLNILFVIQYIRCFKNFWGSANVLLQIPLKIGKKIKVLSPAYSLKLKNIILFLNRGLIFFFKWSYSQRCFDVAKRCQNRRWKWQRCFDVVLRCSIQRWITPQCFNVVQHCQFQRWRTQRCFKQRRTDVEMFAGINNCFCFWNQIKGAICVALHDFVPVTIWRGVIVQTQTNAC